ncbi:MAG: hypothetical protein NTV24_03905 [Candidatus Woesebacteria bacterium]|nr:hypothetical protein [Candidatus Woesebacteria bacterium]
MDTPKMDVDTSPTNPDTTKMDEFRGMNRVFHSMNNILPGVKREIRFPNRKIFRKNSRSRSAKIVQWSKNNNFSGKNRQIYGNNGVKRSVNEEN